MSAARGSSNTTKENPIIEVIKQTAPLSEEETLKALNAVKINFPYLGDDALDEDGRTAYINAVIAGNKTAMHWLENQEEDIAVAHRDSVNGFDALSYALSYEDDDSPSKKRLLLNRREILTDMLEKHKAIFSKQTEARLDLLLIAAGGLNLHVLTLIEQSAAERILFLLKLLFAANEKENLGAIKNAFMLLKISMEGIDEKAKEEQEYLKNKFMLFDKTDLLIPHIRKGNKKIALYLLEIGVANNKNLQNLNDEVIRSYLNKSRDAAHALDQEDVFELLAAIKIHLSNQALVSLSLALSTKDIQFITLIKEYISDRYYLDEILKARKKNDIDNQLVMDVLKLFYKEGNILFDAAISLLVEINDIELSQNIFTKYPELIPLDFDDRYISMHAIVKAYEDGKTSQEHVLKLMSIYIKPNIAIRVDFIASLLNLRNAELAFRIVSLFSDKVNLVQQYSWQTKGYSRILVAYENNKIDPQIFIEILKKIQREEFKELTAEELKSLIKIGNSSLFIEFLKLKQQNRNFKITELLAACTKKVFTAEETLSILKLLKDIAKEYNYEDAQELVNIRHLNLLNFFLAFIRADEKQNLLYYVCRSNVSEFVEPILQSRGVVLNDHHKKHLTINIYCEYLKACTCYNSLETAIKLLALGAIPNKEDIFTNRTDQQPALRNRTQSFIRAYIAISEGKNKKAALQELNEQDKHELAKLFQGKEAYKHIQKLIPDSIHYQASTQSDHLPVVKYQEAHPSAPPIELERQMSEGHVEGRPSVHVKLGMFSEKFISKNDPGEEMTAEQKLGMAKSLLCATECDAFWGGKGEIVRKDLKNFLGEMVKELEKNNKQVFAL